MLFRLITFLIINFSALAIGSIFTAKGVPSEWYADLNKAPWTPPGWVFGAAWTSIMICFALYMAYLWPIVENKKLLVCLFMVQWVLNILWNPAFFHYNQIGIGLVLIVSLTILVGIILLYYFPLMKFKSIFMAPYLVWLIIASSLNAYILLNN